MKPGLLWLSLKITLAGSLLSVPGFALNPARQISQYGHTAWRIRDGVFGGTPNVVTQTADGYIWIGTNNGLVRFDGAHFAPWTPPEGQHLPDPRIYSLVGARDGSLWIGTARGLARLKGGALTAYDAPMGRIHSIVEDHDGSVWIVRTQPEDGSGAMCRIRDKSYQCFDKKGGLPFFSATHLAQDKQGNFWVGGYFGICRWRPESSQVYFQDTPSLSQGIGVVRALAAAGDGSVWAGIERSGQRLELKHFVNGSWQSEMVAGIATNNTDLARLFIDREGAIWVATAKGGVFRILNGVADHIGSADGLSSDAVASFYEDREGTLWIATSRGLDNLRDLHVTSYSMREGLTADSASTVLASRDGTVWIGNAGGLDYIRGNKISAIREGHGLPGRNVTTMLEDHSGRLWVGVDTGLWIYDKRRLAEKGEMQAVVKPDGKPLGTIFSIAEDIDHDMWVRAGYSLYRIRGVKVAEEFTSEQIRTSYLIAAHPQGGVLLGLTYGSLVRFAHGQPTILQSDRDFQHDHVRDLLVEPDGSVWGTTLNELFRWKDGKRRPLDTRNGLPCDSIYALVKDKLGSLWLSTGCGFVAIAGSGLEKWWAHPDSVVSMKVVDALEGGQPGLTSLKPQATMSPDGRLWFVNAGILQMLDPADPERNTLPPPVQIEQVTADRKEYASIDGLRLPPLTRDLEIDYAGLSFVAPERVRFRYKLEGVDRDWKDAGTRREALYGQLPPGNYTFRVMACNNDGVWNEAGAALAFYMPPTYYQTAWFKGLCVLAALGTLWLLYLMRLRQVTAQVQARLDTRLVERERIARELHDTLLQGFNGLVLRFQAVMKQMPATGPTRQQMEKALERADEVLLEGRLRVLDLRSEAIAGNGLSEMLAKCGEELARDHAVPFSLAVVGTPQELDQTVCDEAFRIGREGLINAFQHSEASRIESEITYDRSALHLRVRDDGRGIDQKMLYGGKPGHWGLSGMRERSHAIGGHLSIWSNPGAGTEIDLTIPAKVAYCNGAKRRRWPWTTSGPDGGR